MIAQIELDTLTGRAGLTARYEPVRRFPSACRDISVLCEKGLSAQSIKDVIEEAKEDLVTAVDITDMYEGAQIPPGQKGVTFSIKYVKRGILHLHPTQLRHLASDLCGYLYSASYL